MFGFEKLDAWQVAIDFANDVYRLTKAFPHDERFGLTSQMRRASVSISANLAEGSGRGSRRDFARFVEIAFGSLLEVISHATIARRQNLLDEPAYRGLYGNAERLGRMLSGLQRGLGRRPRAGEAPDEAAPS